MKTEHKLILSQFIIIIVLVTCILTIVQVTDEKKASLQEQIDNLQVKSDHYQAEVNLLTNALNNQSSKDYLKLHSAITGTWERLEILTDEIQDVEDIIYTFQEEKR